MRQDFVQRNVFTDNDDVRHLASELHANYVLTVGKL